MDSSGPLKSPILRQLYCDRGDGLPEVNATVYRGAVERKILCNSVDDHSELRFLLWIGGEPRRSANRHFDGGRKSGLCTAVAPRDRRATARRSRPLAGKIWASCAAKFWPCIRAVKRAGCSCISLRSVSCASRHLPFAQLTPTRSGARAGKVYLVGAGPGDPDLLTVKALRLIQSADVVLHDDLVTQAILDLAPRNAEVVNVGKRCGVKSITQEEINALMIEQARAGRTVVRLKSGDPLIFGRAAEEIAALAEAELPLRLFLEFRRLLLLQRPFGARSPIATAASNVIFSTGHHAQSQNHAPQPALKMLRAWFICRGAT